MTHWSVLWNIQLWWTMKLQYVGLPNSYSWHSAALGCNRILKTQLVVELCQKCIVYDEQVRGLAKGGRWQARRGEEGGLLAIPNLRHQLAPHQPYLPFFSPLRTHWHLVRETIYYSLLSLVATTLVLAYQDHSFSPVAVLTQHLSGSCFGQLH